MNTFTHGDIVDFEQKNEKINLKTENIEEFTLQKNNANVNAGEHRDEYITITNSSPYTVEYKDKHGNETESILTDEQHSELISRLQTLPLADFNPGKTYYSLEVDIKDDDSYYLARVEGEEVFSLAQKYISENDKNE